VTSTETGQLESSQLMDRHYYDLNVKKRLGTMR